MASFGRYLFFIALVSHPSAFANSPYELGFKESIQLVGSSKTAANKNREAAVRSAVDGNVNRFHQCFDDELKQERDLPLRVDFLFYFRVSKKGFFEDVSYDFINPDFEFSEDLTDCLLKNIRALRTFPWRNEQIYRLWITVHNDR